MKDPRRLLEDTALPEIERRSLAAARAVEPPPELAGEVWSDLVVALGATGAAGSGAAAVGHGAPAGAASGTSIAAGAGAKVAVLKALALGAMVGTITTGGAVALTSPHRPAAPRSSAAAPRATTVGRRAWPLRNGRRDLAAAEARAQESAAPDAPSTDDSSRTRSREDSHAEARASSALSPPNGAPSGRDELAAPKGSSIAAFDGVGTPHSVASGEADAARTEARLVGTAREALQRQDAARALSVLEDTQRRFPGGILLQEREALSISALAALGRQPEAAARAAVFLRAYPNSPHAERVRAALRAR